MARPAVSKADLRVGHRLLTKSRGRVLLGYHPGGRRKQLFDALLVEARGRSDPVGYVIGCAAGTRRIPAIRVLAAAVAVDLSPAESDAVLLTALDYFHDLLLATGGRGYLCVEPPLAERQLRSMLGHTGWVALQAPADAPPDYRARLVKFVKNESHADGQSP